MADKQKIVNEFLLVRKRYNQLRAGRNELQEKAEHPLDDLQTHFADWLLFTYALTYAEISHKEYCEIFMQVWFAEI